MSKYAVRTRQTGSCSTSNTSPYVIIGDTVASTLYADRLLRNNVTQPVSVLIEGFDRLGDQNIEDLDFTYQVNAHPNHYTMLENIHLVQANQELGGTVNYRVGAGILGDFIAAYFIPRIGPWFDHSTHNNVNNLLLSTIKVPLITQERSVTDFLTVMFNLYQTNNIIVTRPSILTSQYVFIKGRDDDYSRQLFYEQYEETRHPNMCESTTGVQYYTQTTNIFFSAGTTGTGVHTIQFNSLAGTGTVLSNVKTALKTNPFTYLRIEGEGLFFGRLKPPSISMPTFYRCVIAIPLNNTPVLITHPAPTGGTGTMSATGGVNLTGVTGLGDGVTSYISFSMRDPLLQQHSSDIAWMMECYTTPLDLSVPGAVNGSNANGSFGSSGSTLLIVEGLSIKNRRNLSYVSGNELKMILNSNNVEDGYMTQFANMVYIIYQAYTGNTTTITPSILLQNSTVCDSSGRCQSSETIIDYPVRESPMITAIQTINNLYGGADYYPKFITR